ncbi:hypothetical protein [Lachnoclostridium sp. An169]|uniref:hypothetical protein n=1 Tax=Lachnoclostridium sp. An169 TaxID=1965569 RepID=UPI0013A66F36|nr:hypothetical protein [Lachnoclostridium sp. An169]
MLNEILLYGGSVLAAAALIAGAVYFIIARIRKAQLDIQYDKEYGERTKEKG